MRLTVLGSGTFLPSPVRGSACHHVLGDRCSLLLDCGSGALHGMARHGVSWAELTHVAVTHLHPDHAGDLPALLFALRNRSRGSRARPLLTLVGPSGFRGFLEALAAAWGEWVLDPGFPVHVVEAGEDFRMVDEEARLTLRATPTPHTAASLAFRAEVAGASVGYTGDTGPSSTLGSFFSGCGLLVSECAWADPGLGPGHLWPEAVGALAREADPELLVLTHLYPPLTPDEAVARVGHVYVGEVVAAEDGMTASSSPAGWRVDVDPVRRPV